jgi:LacI family transcriptional regulator
MNEANLKIDTNAIFDGDYRFETGYKFGKSVLEHNNIDGVFAFNDLMAYGLFKAMFETQTSSNKIKIVGYDNLKQSEMFGLPLTSVEQDINLLGNIACDQLLKQIDDENYKENTVLKPKIAA